MPHSFHKNVSVDCIFFFAKCYHCLGEAYSVTEGILIYVIKNIYLYRLYNILICKQNKENSAYCGEACHSEITPFGMLSLYVCVYWQIFPHLFVSSRLGQLGCC